MNPARIKRLRKRLGLSQAGFAKAFGLSHSVVRAWERGGRGLLGPSRALLLLIEAMPDECARVLASKRKARR